VACVVGVVLGVAAPLDEVVHIGLGDLPWVSVDQPVVGLLDLPAVVDLLIEDAELIADAVADGRALEGGQRVETARGQPSQTAVAEPRFLLACQHVVEVLPQRRQRLPGRVLDAEVEQVAAPSGIRPRGSRVTFRPRSSDVCVDATRLSCMRSRTASASAR
jgi:hypothetical protein